MMSEFGLIFFRLLWVTIMFGGFSISVMIILCIRRAIEERARERRKPTIDRARQALMLRINGVMNHDELRCLLQLTPKEIMDLASDISPMIKGENRSQLGSYLETEELRLWLTKRIQSYLPYRRIEAARWLECFHGEWAQSLLISCLEDSVFSVRTTAAISLIRTDSKINLVIDTLLDESGAKENSTKKALAIIADQAPDQLHAYLKEFAPASLRRLLQDPLVDRGYLPIAADLEQQLDAEQAECRRSALSSLMKLKHPRTRTYAQRMIFDASASVRAEAERIQDQLPESTRNPLLTR